MTARRNRESGATRAQTWGLADGPASPSTSPDRFLRGPIEDRDAASHGMNRIRGRRADIARSHGQRSLVASHPNPEKLWGECRCLGRYCGFVVGNGTRRGSSRRVGRVHVRRTNPACLTAAPHNSRSVKFVGLDLSSRPQSNRMVLSSFAVRANLHAGFELPSLAQTTRGQTVTRRDAVCREEVRVESSSVHPTLLRLIE